MQDNLQVGMAIMASICVLCVLMVLVGFVAGAFSERRDVEHAVSAGVMIYKDEAYTVKKLERRD